MGDYGLMSTIDVWAKLGLEQAIDRSLSLIEEKKVLNAVVPDGVATREMLGTIASGKSELAVPYLAKDNMATLELPTTAGSKMLKGFVSPYEATVIRKLREAGAVMIGKTNMDEFAMGSSTENSVYGPTLNPLDPKRVPGGSSGGAAAAVAAGLVPFALGSDTGGSIRQPAAFCGVVGMMPTYGRVSRYGLLAMASSLDRIGPITRTVEDAARVLQVIAGQDDKDSTTVGVPVPDYVAECKKPIDGIRIGFMRGILSSRDTIAAGGLDEKDSFLNNVRDEFRNRGVDVVGVDLPHEEYALATYYIIQPAEVSANLARYDGIRYGFSKATDPDTDSLADVYKKTRAEGFGSEVKRRIMLGTYTLSAGFRDAYYDKAQKVRALIKQDFDKAFEKVDVIVSLTTPTVAFELGARVSDPLEMYKADLLTTPASMAGLPAISIPCGMVGGMPVGLQIIGRPFEEEVVLRVARAFEEATATADWRQELNAKLGGMQ